MKTTFASSYAGEVSLAGMLGSAGVEPYDEQATGEKYLVGAECGRVLGNECVQVEQAHYPLTSVDRRSIA